nr:MAG TPA: N acetylmuramidase [Caudoviricetes sp.]
MNIRELNAQMRKDYHAAGYTGKNIIFAVLDTGAEPVGRLRGKVIKLMGDEPRSDHGTFVASIVNEYCPDAEIWSYRCDYPVHIIEAMRDVVERAKATDKRVIVNMSLETDNANIKDAVDACVAAGIPFVCAAGNDGHEVLNKYPTCFESPITVAALQADGKRAYFSTWHNEVDFSDFGQWVDGLDVDGNTVTKSGTSFAAPQLAGKIGLLLSANPDMTEPEVYEALKGMAVDLGNKGRDPLTGYGFVQLSEPTQKEEPKEEPMGERILKLIDKPRMQGDDVKELQTLLDKHGFPCGEIDGVFGPETDTAVRLFQKANGLTVDGKVGEKTWAALRNEPGEPSGDSLAVAEDMTCWLRMMVGWHYIIGAQGHRLTDSYLSARHKDHEGYFTNGRLEWLRGEISRAESMGINLYCADCSGLFFKVNEMMGILPVKDATADGLWRRYCAGIGKDDVRPGDILFRDTNGCKTHMAVVGTDGVYEAAGTAYGVVFRPWADMFSRRTYNRMTGNFDTLKPWTHYGRLKALQ